VAALPPVFFNNFTLDIGNDVHTPFSTQDFKIALTNTQPDVATDVEFADIVEISATNGYTAGGNTCPFGSWSQVNGKATLFLQDPANFVATGGSFDEFQWLVLYNSSAPAGTGLIFYADYGAPVTLTDGTPLPVQLDGDKGVWSSQGANI